MATDPICRMQVDESTALKAERGGQTHYFCSEHCRRKFLEGDPRSRQSTITKIRMSDRGIWVVPSTSARCVKASKATGPAVCPRCGMALEPAKPKPPSGRRSTPALCTRRSSSTGRERVQMRYGTGA